MARIIAGTAKGRTIATPTSRDTRPTADRVREAVFSRLMSWGVVEDAVVADLYAGSGALGLEALSRGAAHATFVERGKAAAGVIRKNCATLGFQQCTEVRQHSVRGVLEHPPARPWTLVFLDPPYDLAEEEWAEVLQRLGEPGYLDQDAVLVAERSRRSPAPPWPAVMTEISGVKYGDTMMWHAEVEPSQ